MTKLIDQWGNPISTAVLKQEQATVTTGSIRRPRTHDEASNLTPVRLARLLKSSVNGDPEAYLTLAEDMEERDLHYAGVLSARKQQVAGLEITVEPASENAADVDHADMIRKFVARDAFETELLEVLDAVGKGFSGTEILWETSERQWQPRELKWRDPRWFRFSPEDGETPLLRDNGADLPLAPYKWIFHTAKAKSGLPIRGGIARAVCWTYLFKSFTGKDWAIFCEAYGQPLRLGKWGEGASEKDKDVLLEAVINIGTDYAAIVPQSMTVEFIKADVSGSLELYERRSDWLDRQVSKVVLGQTGTTDAIAGGYAVGKVLNGTKSYIERSDAKQTAASLNRDLVKPYIDLNKGPQKAYPKIKIGRPEEIDTEKFMKNVEIYVGLGGKVGMAFIGGKIGVPTPKEGEELLQGGAKPEQLEDDPSADKTMPTPPKIRAAHRVASTAGAKDAIDRSVDAIVSEDWEPMIVPMIDGLEEKIAGAATLEEARRLLADHFATMDVTVLADTLARAAFASRLAGEYDEDISGA